MTEYVGFDVFEGRDGVLREGRGGKGYWRGARFATDPRALFAALREHCLCPGRIVLETGTLSGWLARDLGRLGVSVEVIDARQANAVMRLQHNKTDANDAALLAEIARTGFCRPCGGEERGGAGGAGTSQGALSPGAPAARYGERDPWPVGVVGSSLSQGLSVAMKNRT